MADKLEKDPVVAIRYKKILYGMAEREGFEPSDPVSRINCLAGSCHRPLGHLSTLIYILTGIC